MTESTTKDNNKSEPRACSSPIISGNEVIPGDSAISQTPVSAQDVPRHESSTRTRKSRSASLLQNLMESRAPLGAWHAIGEDAMQSPTIPEIKNGSYTAKGWSHEGQLESRNHNPRDIYRRRLSRASSQIYGSRSQGTMTDTTPTVAPVPAEPKSASLIASTTAASSVIGPDPETGEYPNGYRFPRKHTWSQSFAIFGAAFWRFFWTIKGFCIIIYALNVVAWGAMIFFLLIPGATPAMCKSYPNCEDKRYSARQIWIENCSQILTALFCVTAFGLLPWRARDFYYMIQYQAMHDQNALRKLAGFYRRWYRLPGSDKLPECLSPPPKPADLKVNMFGNVSQNEKVDEKLLAEIKTLEANPAVPLPAWSLPEAPLTGIRARPTKFKALAAMIWFYILNTLFQVGLCVVMWGFNRFQRDTGYFTAMVALFIALGCFTGIGAGIVVGKESKIIKEIEGIPIKDYDEPESPQDFKDRMAKEKKEHKKKRITDVEKHATFRQT